jgi:hypothetical protein
MFAAGFVTWTEVPLGEYILATMGRTFEQILADAQHLDADASAAAARADDSWKRADPPSAAAQRRADRLVGGLAEMSRDLASRMHGGKVRLTAWHTELEPLRIGMPNWIVPVIGLACAILALATLKGWLAVPWQLPFGLAVYALVHATVFAFHAGRGLRVGLGLALACGLALIALSFRAAPTPPPEPPPHPAPRGAPSTS